MSAPLRLDERLFRELLEVVRESVVVLDREGHVLYVNYVEEGYRLDEVVGTDAADFIHPDFRDQHRNRLRRIVEYGEVQDFEVPSRGEPGERQWYAGRGAPIFRNGTVVGVVVVMRNVTELRRACNEAGHLKQLLPVCPWCKDKVKVGDDHWVSLEEYLYTSDGLHVTHGMCPECSDEMVSGI